MDFLSHAALVGFMAGAAIIIGLQQLKGLLGLSHFTTKTDAISVLESVYKSLHHQITSGEKVSRFCYLIYKFQKQQFIWVLLLTLDIILCLFQWYPLNFVIGCSFLIFLLIARFIVSNEIYGIHVPPQVYYITCF